MIAAGKDAVFTLVLRAPDATPDAPSATTATIASGTYDNDPNDKFSRITTSYVANYDLVATSLTASSNAPIVGQPLTYTFVLTNKGPDLAANVIVAVALPSTISESSPQTLFPVGTIAPGGSRTVTIALHPTTVGGFPVTFDATSHAAGESDPSNNYATSSLTIQAPPPVYDLVATALTASPNAPIAGQPLTYSFVVTNNGPDTATGVVVAVALPSTISDSGLQTLIPLGTIADGRIANRDDHGPSHRRRGVRRDLRRDRLVRGG